MIQDYRLPFNPGMVFIGDNVRIASNVTLITHDVTHHMLNDMARSAGEAGEPYCEKIVGAGSAVTKDLPDNSVRAGVPCRRIGGF